MKFSIIVPVYNVEEYLDDCVKSILSQNYKDFELILVDDGSPDKCGEMCDGYAKADDRVRVIHKPNGGLADARNAGMQEAKGDYLVFIDSDDKISYTEALKDIVAAIADNPETDIFVTKTWKHSTDKTSKGDELLTSLLRNGLNGDMFRVTVWDKVYKREYIEKNGFTFKKGYVHEDLLWTFITIANADKCTILDKDFYERNINDQSITRSVSQKSIYNRAFSKLNIAKIGCDTFATGNFSRSLLTVVYEFYMGVYINGLSDGSKLNDRQLIDEFHGEIKKTANVFKYGLLTQRKLYKIISVLYNILGYVAAIAIKKLISKRG